MDLYCCEIAENENTAYDDPTLLQDRVLTLMLKDEERCVIPSTATLSDQREVTSAMRRIVAEWMMEVCEEQKCQDEVFSLAMNYMDRFLLCCSIMKNQLQLLGTACMLIASKLRESRPLSGETLVFYTDNSVTKQQLSSWELLVLSKLKWDIAALTAHDFLKQLVSRLPMEDNWMMRPGMVLNHAKTLITLCGREFVFSKYHPSIIASACTASALVGVGWVAKTGRTLQDLLDKMATVMRVEKDYISECLILIDQMIKDSTCDEDSLKKEDCETIRRGELTPPPGKNPDAALTPTDVYDVHF